MILIDTGPLVALFDPRDADHAACHQALREVDGPLYTTEAVLTEVFHMLGPAGPGANGVKQFLQDGFASVLPLDKAMLSRCFEYMSQYEDQPMDFADATLVTAAEALSTRRVLTLDFADFSVYRVKRGHRLTAMELVGQALLA